MKTRLRPFLPFLCCLLVGSRLHAAADTAATETTARRTLAAAVLADGPERLRLLDQLADSGSKLAKDVLTAWTRDEVYVYEFPDHAKVAVLLEDQQDAAGRARAIRIDDGQPLVDSSRHELRFSPDDLAAVATDMRLRGVIQQCMDKLTLADPDPEARRSAVVKLGNSGKQAYVPVLEARRAKEPSAEVRRAIDEAAAQIQLGSPIHLVRLAAAKRLGALNALGSIDSLRRFAAAPGTSPDEAAVAEQSIKSIDAHIARVNFFGTIFRGASLGSILLVVALGLAITFGLMGIINMAHGEMIAVGAYTCYVTQNLFGTGFGFRITLPFHVGTGLASFGITIPGLNATGPFYQSYFLFALPLSFFTAALAGYVVERSVIRFLYRRPLESLLATWGVSLIMQQCFRMIFGANNVQVDSPTWLLGHFTIHDVSFGYNRVFVVGFAVLIVIGTWLLLTKTPLGLLIRAVMQNREMAACMGVRSERVNLLTFAFGSGLAGLAGAFLSQIGNVGPSLGQSYIVDSFMTVVVGGVGSIVGTVCAAAGIGTADQVLQQVLGSPVMGKIIVLATIILFLQWKPGGLFATKGRGLDG